MTVDSQPRATGPRQGDEPTQAPLPDRPADAAPRDRDVEPDEEPGRAASDRPSGVQVTASALAAVTATAMLSTLGVAGTLIGAALSSIVTVFASYLYSSSLRRTADKVAAAPPVQKVRARTRVGTTAVLKVPADGAATDGRRTSTLAMAAAQTAAAQEATGHDGRDGHGTVPGGRLDRLRATWQAVVDRYGYRRIVVTVLAFFAAVLAAVTIIELAAGKPLSDVVRNEEGAGTSLFGAVPDAVETTTGPSSEGGFGAGTDPRTDQEGTDGELPDPAQQAPGDQQPGQLGESAPEPTPSSDATDEGGTEEEATPSPTPSPAPEQSPAPGDETPEDRSPAGEEPVQPAPDVQQESVPEPAPAQ